MSVSTSHEYLFDLINIRQCHGSVEQQEHASHEGLPSKGDGSAGRWASHRDDEPLVDNLDNSSHLCAHSPDRPHHR